MLNKLKGIAGKAKETLSSTTSSVGEFIDREDTRAAIETAKKTASAIGSEAVKIGKGAVTSDLAKDAASGAAVGAVAAIPVPIVGPAIGATVGAGLGVYKNLNRPGQPTHVASSPKTDIYGEMLKLEDLKQKGILTEEEFTDRKKKLLDEDGL